MQIGNNEHKIEGNYIVKKTGYPETYYLIGDKSKDGFYLFIDFTDEELCKNFIQEKEVVTTMTTTEFRQIAPNKRAIIYSYNTTDYIYYYQEHDFKHTETFNQNNISTYRKNPTDIPQPISGNTFSSGLQSTEWVKDSDSLTTHKTYNKNIHLHDKTIDKVFKYDNKVLNFKQAIKYISRNELDEDTANTLSELDGCHYDSTVTPDNYYFIMNPTLYNLIKENSIPSYVTLYPSLGKSYSPSRERQGVGVAILKTVEKDFINDRHKEQFESVNLKNIIEILSYLNYDNPDVLFELYKYKFILGYKKLVTNRKYNFNYSWLYKPSLRRFNDLDNFYVNAQYNLVNTFSINSNGDFLTKTEISALCNTNYIIKQLDKESRKLKQKLAYLDLVTAESDTDLYKYYNSQLDAINNLDLTNNISEITPSVVETIKYYLKNYYTKGFITFAHSIDKNLVELDPNTFEPKIKNTADIENVKCKLLQYFVYNNKQGYADMATELKTFLIDVTNRGTKSKFFTYDKSKQGRLKVKISVSVDNNLKIANTYQTRDLNTLCVQPLNPTDLHEETTTTANNSTKVIQSGYLYITTHTDATLIPDASKAKNIISSLQYFLK